MEDIGNHFEDPDTANKDQVVEWIVEKLWKAEMPEDVIYYI